MVNRLRISVESASAGATAYDVLNVTSAPSLVPAAFVAEILKWYSVFATRPAAIDAETATGLDPDPGSAGRCARPVFAARAVFELAFGDRFAVGVDRALRVAVVWVTRDVALLLNSPSPFGAPTPDGPS